MATTTSTGKKAAAKKKASSPMMSKLRSILVPMDFSEPSLKALSAAFDMARTGRAKLILLNVIEPIPVPEMAFAYPMVFENEAAADASRRRLVKEAREAGIPPARLEKCLVRFGRAFHEITEAARTLKADLIVIPTHGYTGLKHALMGSTAERVVRHAPCPVLVLRAE